VSQAAVDYVGACTHPQVNQVARDVLTAIARLIPEGETTTSLISMGALATLAHVDRRTVWTWLPALVAIGEVRVVDGGRGRKARYTLVHVAGVAPPIAAPLPLRADLQAVRPRPVVALPLFDDPPIGRTESEELVIPITSWAARAITRITSYLQLVIELVIRSITRITSWPFVRSNREELVIATCDPCDPTCDPAPPLDGTRARAVLLLKELLLPPAAEPQTRPPPDPNPSRCRWFPKTHAWCAGQRTHLPTPLDEDFRRNLGRLANETDAEQRARAWVIYATEDAKIPADARTSLNGFDHWRPILAAYLARAAPTRPAVNPRAAPAGDLQARAIEERRQRQGSGFS